MERFFAKPTTYNIAEVIYKEILFTHETGGSKLSYKIERWMSTDFVNELIDILSESLLDVDVIENKNGYIVLDWS